MNKVEIGQGIRTAIAQIAAEELDVDLGRVRIVVADTGAGDAGSSTTGSNSIQGLGGAVRQAAADLRHHAVATASRSFGVEPSALSVSDGTIRTPDGRSVDYWDAVPRDAEVEEGAGRPKSSDAYTVVGRSVPRDDLPLKVTAGGAFVQDLLPAGGWHARVIRPPGYDARLTAAPEDAGDGVWLVRDGSFLAVAGPDETEVEAAADRVRAACRWSGGAGLPDQATLYDHLLAQPSAASLVVDGAVTDDPVPAIETPASATVTHDATYRRPYQLHGSLAPSAAMAQWTDDGLTVWSHSQGVYALRGALAGVLRVEPEAVRVVHAENSGCYGHNGADDVALDAALVARALPGTTVLVKWTREDEHAWEPFGTCAVLKLQGSLDANGRVVDWNHDVWSYAHGSRPRPSGESSSLLSARFLADPVPPPIPGPPRGRHSGMHRNSDPLYAFSRRRIVNHFVRDSPLRVSALRGLGAFANVFAIESFVDELAALADADPVAFRIGHLEDPRAKDVIERAAEAADWGRARHDGEGRGIGFARYKNEKAYVAVVADVAVDTGTGVIGLKKMTIVGDVGLAVNPDGALNQLEGGVIQAASWTLKEAVTFDRERVRSVDWETYPVLRFDEVPDVEAILVDRPDDPSLGCGEATQGPTPAAIANAVYEAVGVRLREIPFTPARVLAAKDRDRSPSTSN